MILDCNQQTTIQAEIIATLKSSACGLSTQRLFELIKPSQATLPEGAGRRDVYAILVRMERQKLVESERTGMQRTWSLMQVPAF